MSIISDDELLRTLRINDAYGVLVVGPDHVQFRTGSASGTACIISDPDCRGLLGPVIQKLISTDADQRRPWNDAELQLLRDIVPPLHEAGVVGSRGAQTMPQRASSGSASAAMPRDLSQSRVGVVGHGILGKAVLALLSDMPCGSVTVIESSSVSELGRKLGVQAAGGGCDGGEADGGRRHVLRRPRDVEQWTQIVEGSDWIVAAQDSFEPEELAALNTAALRSSIPWSLVCFDGYEGWIGPTFIPGQTACFSCFSRRLLAGAAAPKHVFMDPDIKLHRVPAPWSSGLETGAWVSLISSIFALELVAATQGRSFTFNQMLIVHRLNLTFQRESVLRLPRCPSCSPQGDAPRPNVFAQFLMSRGR
jgi:bacteriocin biosynthesis cyclodehydratase domain-containing protein